MYKCQSIFLQHSVWEIKGTWGIYIWECKGSYTLPETFAYGGYKWVVQMWQSNCSKWLTLIGVIIGKRCRCVAIVSSAWWSLRTKSGTEGKGSVYSVASAEGDLDSKCAAQMYPWFHLGCFHSSVRATFLCTGLFHTYAVLGLVVTWAQDAEVMVFAPITGALPSIEMFAYRCYRLIY